MYRQKAEAGEGAGKGEDGLHHVNTIGDAAQLQSPNFSMTPTFRFFFNFFFSLSRCHTKKRMGGHIRVHAYTHISLFGMTMTQGPFSVTPSNPKLAGFPIVKSKAN